MRETTPPQGKSNTSAPSDVDEGEHFSCFFDPAGNIQTADTPAQEPITRRGALHRRHQRGAASGQAALISDRHTVASVGGVAGGL